MKRAIIAMMFFILFPFVSNASTYERFTYGAIVNEYGAANMESDKTNNYVFHNNANYANAKTTDEHYGGRRSLEIDYRSAVGDSEIHYTIPRSLISQTMMRRALYLEYFIKGTNGTGADTEGRVSTVVQLYNESGFLKTLSVGFQVQSAENGWFRIHGLVPMEQNVDYSQIEFVVFIRRAGEADTTYDKIYIDDMSAKLAPISIAADAVSWKGGMMPLQSINVNGVDKDGVCERIETKDLINYQVRRGRASVSGGNLIYTGSVSGAVTMQAEFLGITCTFNITVDLQQELDVSDVICSGGVYSVSVINNTDADARVVFIVALYDGERLSRVYTKTEVVNAGASQSIVSDKVEAPFYVGSVNIQAFVFRTAD